MELILLFAVLFCIRPFAEKRYKICLKLFLKRVDLSFLIKRGVKNMTFVLNSSCFILHVIFCEVCWVTKIGIQMYFLQLFSKNLLYIKNII